MKSSGRQSLRLIGTRNNQGLKRRLERMSRELELRK